MTNRTLAIWRSGFVNRWHNHPCHALRNSQDTNDAHMGRCVRLAIALFPGDWELVNYLAHHDCPEVVSGDIPGPAKRENSDLARADACISAQWHFDNYIDVAPCKRAKLIDKLDAYLFARSVDKRIVKHAAWKSELEAIMKSANELERGWSVDGIINDQ